MENAQGLAALLQRLGPCCSRRAVAASAGTRDKGESVVSARNIVDESTSLGGHFERLNYSLGHSSRNY
jgi:hypothetical protein